MNILGPKLKVWEILILECPMHMPQYAKYGSGKINCLSLRVLYSMYSVYTNIVQCSVGGLEIGRFLKKVIMSLFDTILALKRADCCVLVLCLVLGDVAGLLDDLLQPPGRGSPRGKLPPARSGRSAVHGLLVIRSSRNFQKV